MDKHEVCRKTLSLLKKKYKADGLKPELPVLETMLYACCLENASPAEAETAYARLLNSFHDLNEIRVSSINELVPMFQGMEDAEWRALRVKSSLQHVFETTYSFEYENLKRKTHELAVKHLGKIKQLSPFVRSFTLQNALGNHVLPIDDRMHALLVWMGLAEAGSTPEHTGEVLRPFVRKSDGRLFCHVLRCAATDKKYKGVFTAAAAKAQAEANGEHAPHERLEQLLRRGPAAQKKDSRKTASSRGDTAKARKPAAKKGSKSGKDSQPKGTSKKATAAKGTPRATHKKSR